VVEHPPRKLAVILHTDVVGSTSLVRLNETLTHQRIQDTFRRFSETISRHNGIAHEIRGDALVAEFARASDAVTASLAFQAANTTHNEALPDEIRPVIRVGIAIGEVVIADNTVTGEGVVLAQRLEQLAQPGGTVIQGAAYETVPKRLPFDYENLGEHELKGFDQPIRVYAVNMRPGSQIPEVEPLTQPEAGTLGLPDKPSIAVLPFQSLSDDPEQGYFSDAITEDIITELSRFRSLLVVARHSAFAFKVKNIDVKSIGQELNVQYILEGSVRRAGKRVRITAQLVEAASGNHVWAERYDRELEELFAIQDDLVRAIASTVGGRVEAAAKRRASRLRSLSIPAFDLCLRAQALQDQNTKEAYEEAEHCLRQAIEIDPDMPQAYHQLSLVKFWQWFVHWSENPEDSFAEAFQLAEKALALDETDGLVHAHLCLLHIYRYEFDEGSHRIGSALRLNPNDTKVLGIYGNYLIAIGESRKAIELFDTLRQINPIEPAWITRLKAIAYMTDGQYEDAISILKSLEAPTNLARGWLIASLANSGRLEEARKVLENFLSVAEKEMVVFPGRNLSKWKKAWRGIPYKNPEDDQQFFEGLRKAGLMD